MHVHAFSSEIYNKPKASVVAQATLPPTKCSSAHTLAPIMGHGRLETPLYAAVLAMEMVPETTYHEDLTVKLLYLAKC